MKQLILLLVCFPFLTICQNIDHWETVIFDNDTWKYLEGTYEPDTNWRKLTFNDSAWLEGQGGIGYGDGDDSTQINSVIPRAPGVPASPTTRVAAWRRPGPRRSGSCAKEVSGRASRS